MTWRRHLGEWLFPRLPVTRHVFNHLRLEGRALWLRLNQRFNPWLRRRYHTLSLQKDVLVNVGCGPFGVRGWVNIDIDAHAEVTLAADCRRRLPLAKESAQGIHVEHFLEHLDPLEELLPFLKECHRVLLPGGVLRIIVPDAERYLKAYLSADWTALEQIGCGGESPRKLFPTKMDAINHVFLQTWEHYGGWDFDRMKHVLGLAGFSKVSRCEWRQGDFPTGCIDREQHRPYSLYVEAVR